MSEIQHGQTDLLVCARKGVNEVSFSFTFQLLLRFLSSLNVCVCLNGCLKLPRSIEGPYLWAYTVAGYPKKVRCLYYHK